MTSVFALTMLLSLVYIFVVRDDLFMVSARILVKLGREQSPPASVLGSGPQVVGYRTAEVNTETEIFQSRQLYEDLVTQLKLDQPGKPPVPPAGLFQRVRFEAKQFSKAIKDWKDDLLIRAGLRPRLTERQKVIAQLQESMRVQAATDSNVFVAILSTPFREGTAAVLDKHIDNYLRYRQRVFAENSTDLFAEESRRTSEKLRQAESELQAFEQEHEISAYDKQKEVLIEQLAQAEAAEKDTAVMLADIEGKVRRMEAAMKAPQPNFGQIGDFPRESLQHNLIIQLTELEREREKLRLRELDTSDKIRNNRDQFNVIAGTLQANLGTLLGERREQNRLRRQETDRLHAQLNGLHKAQARWRDLKRQVGEVEAHNALYRRKLEETRANDTMTLRDLSNVAVIERPADPIQPVGIRKTTLLQISLGVAIVLGLAWITLLEFFDQGVESPAELEQLLGRPVLQVQGEQPRMRSVGNGGTLVTNGPS